jgi:hypothetical protein
MMSAPVEAHLAEIAEPRVHGNAQHGALVMRVADLGMRKLGEVGDLEHTIERLHEIAVTALAHSSISGGALGHLRVEIVIVAAQAFEHREIFVVIDRGHHFAQPAELLAAGRIGGGALLRQRRQDIILADREVAIARVCHEASRCR